MVMTRPKSTRVTNSLKELAKESIPRFVSPEESTIFREPREVGKSIMRLYNGAFPFLQSTICLWSPTHERGRVQPMTQDYWDVVPSGIAAVWLPSP